MKLIKLSQKIYDRLEIFSFENNTRTLENAIEELLDYYYDYCEDQEEDSTYCVNCGDYHD